MLSAFVISTAREVRKTNSKHVTDPALVLGFSLSGEHVVTAAPKARTQQPEGERRRIPLAADQQFLSTLADFYSNKSRSTRQNKTDFIFVVNWNVHIFFHSNCIGRAMLPSQLFNSDLKSQNY